MNGSNILKKKLDDEKYFRTNKNRFPSLK